MIITVFGSTNLAGKEVVKQALHNGHSVRAFGRNVFTANFPEDKNLILQTGALFDENQVYKAIAGSGAVLSVLEGATDGNDHTRSLGIKNIAAQMEKARIKRIISLSGIGILSATDSPGDLLMDQENFPANQIPVTMEYLKAYRVLESSGLEWTLACAGHIKDAGPTGAIASTAETFPGLEISAINAGDLALFMLDELESNRFINQRVAIYTR